MGHSLEEKEAVEHVDLCQHNCTRSYEIHKGNNIQKANDVQDHVPWTSQGFAQTRHHDEGTSLALHVSKLVDTRFRGGIEDWLLADLGGDWD
jgi:hypothetical protein